MSFPAAVTLLVSREERKRSWRLKPWTADAPDESTHTFFLRNRDFIQVPKDGK